jgi:NTE family protein
MLRAVGGGRWRVRALAGLALTALGCGTYFPVNRPLERWDPAYGYRPSRAEPADRSDELMLSLALSGGGTRAAAFAYGVLEELAATRVVLDGATRLLIDEVDEVSGVSGGSFTAAYLGLRGRRIFDDFEERVLRREMQGGLLVRMLWPVNWLKLLSPYWARSDLAADYYDEVIFEHASFADLQRSGGPFVSIHATDLNTGSPFAFTQDQFDYLCSDLSDYPLSRAVAASSAVPLVLSPITLRNYDGCDFVPPAWVTRPRHRSGRIDREYVNARNLLTYLDSRRRFVRLVDGVISDNLGVRGPFEAWVQRRSPPPTRPEGLEARWFVLLVVNAQTTPDAEWERADVLPSLGITLDAATSAQVNRYNFETIELLRRTFEQWNRITSRWDPPLHYGLIETSFLDVADTAERAYLNRLSTSLQLPDEAVDRLRAAARTALRTSPHFRWLLESVEGGANGPDETSSPDRHPSRGKLGLPVD